MTEPKGRAKLCQLPNMHGVNYTQNKHRKNVFYNMTSDPIWFIIMGYDFYTLFMITSSAYMKAIH